MESVRDNPVTIAKSGNSVGKTHGAATIVLWWFLCHIKSQVYTAAAPPLDNLCRLLWGEIGHIIEKRDDLFSDFNQTQLLLTRNSRSFVVGVTIPAQGTPQEREARFSGKHAPHLLFVVDEGDAVPPEVYKGIESCMSGGHCRLLVMFNPRHQAGPVFQKERDQQANIVELSAFSHPNVVTGEDIIPGAVDRNTTVRRILEWTRPLMEGEPRDIESFEVPDFLVGSVAQNFKGTNYPPLKGGWRKIMNPAFSYMVMGQYPAQSINQLVNRSWLTDARMRWDKHVEEFGETPPQNIYPILGQDVGELGIDSSASCLRYGGFIPQFSIWPGEGFGIEISRGKNYYWQGVDPKVTGERCAKIARLNGALFVNVDANGPGAGVVPVAQGELGANINVNRIMTAAAPTIQPEFGEFGILRDQGWWALREWLRTNQGAMLPPDEELLQELTVPTYQITRGKIKVTDKSTMRDLLGRSPDKADALMLTFCPEPEEGYGASVVSCFDYSGDQRARGNELSRHYSRRRRVEE